MQMLVDTHSHTIASTHAYSTVSEYVQEAQNKGMQMLSLTEHGPEMPDSPHPWHFGNRKIIPRVINNIAILRGIEANIMPPNGELDIPPALMPYLDFAIASFHEPVFAPQSEAINTQALINAIESSHCQIIGHMGNPNYKLDYRAVIEAAKANNVLIEINNSSFGQSRVGSTPNCLRIMELVDELDWKVVFASDAHIAFDLGNTTLCQAKAKQVGFPLNRVVNKTAPSFLSFLAQHNKPVVSELKDWSIQFDAESKNSLAP